MKKILLCLMFVLSSCTLPITYNDTHQTKNPNANLLPPMHTKVNTQNLRASFSDVSQDKNKPDRNLRDTMTNDAVSIFEREVEENITQSEGNKKGRIAFRVQYVELENTLPLRAVSIATLGLLNLIGFPADKYTQTMEVEVEVMNLKGGVIKRYTETVQNSEYSAFYWGYRRPNINRKLSAENVKQALKLISAKINTDAEYIKSKLN